MKKPPVFLIFLAVIVLVYALGALTAAWIHLGWQGTGGWVEDNFLRKGPHRLMTRMSMIWFVLLLPLILKFIQWHGWTDCGWTHPESSMTKKQAVRDVGYGGLLAALTMLPALFIMVLAGGRVFDTEATVTGFIGVMFSAAVSAIVIGLIEETLARGIVFRSLGRCWTPTRAALALSVTFAVAHFLRPTEASFDQPTVLAATASALKSMPGVLADTSHVIIRTLNLTLMSLTLCAMVVRRKTIWMAVGAHAVWVWMKKCYGYLTDSVRNPSDIANALGQKTDSTDSLIATLLLGILLYTVLRQRAPSH